MVVRTDCTFLLWKDLHIVVLTVHYNQLLKHSVHRTLCNCCSKRDLVDRIVLVESMAAIHNFNMVTVSMAI